MKDYLMTIVLGAATTHAYNMSARSIAAMKQRAKEIRDNDKGPGIDYSPEYVSTLKRQFYICFPVGIAFLFLRETRYEFLTIINSILAFFVLMLALFAFMCAADMLDHLTNQNTDSDKQPPLK